MTLRRPLLACFLLALSLRAGTAIVTQWQPVFPSFYYNDAKLSEQMARDMCAAWDRGEEVRSSRHPSQRAYAFLLAAVYHILGFHPLLTKLLGAALGAALVLVAFKAFAPWFGPGPALLASGLIALWPTHIFYTSQNFKDPWVLLLAFLSLGAALRLLAPGAGLASLLPLLIPLTLLGFLRGYLLVVLAAAISCVLALRAVRLRGREMRLLACAACLAAATPWAYRSISQAAFSRWLKTDQDHLRDPTTQESLIPRTHDRRGERVIPWNPRNIAETRRVRQASDNLWAQRHNNRQVATQLFPSLELNGWTDVMTFLPKGMFYVLFMPLPGLYPLGGSLGRMLASLENLALLGLVLAALAGFWRGPKDPARLLLLGVFLIMAVGSALLEFDLGSATRHKILYLPLLFPFAAALGPRRPGNRRTKVAQVLECGGPGGTGNQVAAICNNLDPALFDVVLIYAARPGSDPENYRAQVPAAAAYWVPAMRREISPLRDLAAFIRLCAIFRKERPDVVHAHSSKAGVLARLAAWLTGTPRIFYSPHGYSFQQLDRGPASRALYRILEWSVSWIGEIVAVSEGEAQLARGLSWGATVRTVQDPYLGPSDPPPLMPHSGLTVGSCGRLTAARHPEAFVRLAASVEQARFIWIGGGELEPEVRRLAAKLAVAERLEITGWLPADEVVERMRGLDLLVHYSRWEGLPNAVLEAMALGLPVVASDIPGTRDAVAPGETGMLVRDEARLLEAVRHLLQDPQERRRLGRSAQERIRRDFSPAAAWDAWRRLYRP